MKRIKRILAAGSVCLSVGSVHALDFDFSGNFTYDNDVAYFNFSVGSESTVTVFSSSWVEGGFDPILAIWTTAGNLMSQQDDGQVAGSTESNGVFYNHGVWDSYYSVLLGTGDYIATVTQFSNFANSALLSDGFSRAGDPAFTNTLGYGTQPYFNGVWTSNDPRTSSYRFHLLNVAEATHEPPQPPPPDRVPDGGGSLVALGMALTALGGARRYLLKKA